MLGEWLAFHFALHGRRQLRRRIPGRGYEPVEYIGKLLVGTTKMDGAMRLSGRHP